MEEQRSSDARAGISVAVCEPNENLRDEMAAMIAKEKPEARIGTFASGDEILRSEDDFAIYFLDVQGADGLEAAREIRARERGGAGSVIVFVTGYRDYMEEAFDVHAFQYLVKPVDGKKFAEVLCAAWAEAEATRRREGRHILLKLDGITRKVALRDILYLESRNKKVAIHMTEGAHEIRRSMETMEAALGEGFYRCHRCYIVNLAQIADYGPRTIRLENGEQLLLAEKKYPEFVKTYLRYAKSGGVVHV